MRTKTILYIHQSSELYGSDKTLFYLVNGVERKANFKAIVILPNDGPLKKLLEKNNIQVIVFPVLKVSRDFFNFKNIASIPFKIISKTKALNKVLNTTKVDLVHSNTLAVLLGAFYAKRYNIRHVWHVHEIIRKPKLVKILYPLLVNRLSHSVVFNSVASKDFLCSNHPALLRKAIVNLNGIQRDKPTTESSEIKHVKKELLSVKEKDIILCLVGRISKWKGQQLLLEAFDRVKPKFKNLKLIFVGSAPPNQDYLVKELQLQIHALNLENDCKIIDFQENIWKIWDTINIAVVPSTEPEPFGLVAVEAMLAKKPVIAANHGGLKEIILNNKTGYLFKPNDSVDLSNVITKLLSNPKNIKQFGMNGKERSKNLFSIDRHLDQFILLYKKILVDK